MCFFRSINNVDIYFWKVFWSKKVCCLIFCDKTFQFQDIPESLKNNNKFSRWFSTSFLWKKVCCQLFQTLCRVLVRIFPHFFSKIYKILKMSRNWQNKITHVETIKFEILAAFLVAFHQGHHHHFGSFKLCGLSRSVVGPKSTHFLFSKKWKKKC